MTNTSPIYFTTGLDFDAARLAFGLGQTFPMGLGYKAELTTTPLLSPGAQGTIEYRRKVGANASLGAQLMTASMFSGPWDQGPPTYHFAPALTLDARFAFPAHQ